MSDEKCIFNLDLNTAAACSVNSREIQTVGAMQRKARSPWLLLTEKKSTMITVMYRQKWQHKKRKKSLPAIIQHISHHTFALIHQFTLIQVWVHILNGNGYNNTNLSWIPGATTARIIWIFKHEHVDKACWTHADTLQAATCSQHIL